jgi:hypothetical protein
MSSVVIPQLDPKFDTTVLITELIQPLTRRDAPSTEEFLSKIPSDIEKIYNDSFDPFSSDQQLIKSHIASKLEHVADKEQTVSIPAEGDIVEDTWGGTKLALKEFYYRVEIR